MMKLFDQIKQQLILTLALFATTANADDTELFTGQSAESGNTNPKVLIIFDTSGSMDAPQQVKAPYDAKKKYPALGQGGQGDNSLYYRKASGEQVIVDSLKENRFFPASINGCFISQQALNSAGYYSGNIRHYVTERSSNTWLEIPDTSGSSIQFIDCLSDITEVEPTNGKNRAGSALPKGFPINGVIKNNAAQPYTSGTGKHAAQRSQDETYFGSGERVTLYSANYLRWLGGDPRSVGTVPKTRIKIGQEAMESLIKANPNVDFALEVFNSNGSVAKSGGRILQGFTKNSQAASAELINKVNGLIADGSTPICESLYEASLYFGGKGVKYGKADDAPSFDDKVFSGNSYKSPYAGCNKEIFIILITDGAPTHDLDADGDITELDGVGVPMFVNTYWEQDRANSYLIELAKWMHTHDLITHKTVKQTDENADEDDYSKIRNATTYTIGFALKQKQGIDTDVITLLKRTAKQGGGEYFSASDPSDLLGSMQDILNRIFITRASVTSPAVATNSFDRTQTLDSVYYSMFLPNAGPRWQGNIKKYKATSNGIVDSLGNSALDAMGNIKSNAVSFWAGESQTADGSSVTVGGIAAALRRAGNRKILSDLSADGLGALISLNKKNIKAGLKLKSEIDLASYLDVTPQEVEKTLKWSLGQDVDDEDEDHDRREMRQDVFGDPIHSKPVVVNYGGTEATPKLAIFVGTNSGLLHMFLDSGDEVEELWAFMPKDFIKNISPLRQNRPTAEKIYGIDSTVTTYVTRDDKVWLFFGLRRGGSTYYTLDVTDKNKPILKWKIEAKGEFSTMGQTWSQPKIAYSKLNSEGVSKPVLIFGGGYDISKGSHSLAEHEDGKGVGIYMVDADSGKLVWRLHPDTSTKTTVFSGTDSIPSKIATLDSDGDGFIDRLYTGDTGGNIWRIDMPSKKVKDVSVIKLADLSEGALHVDDRRFFSAPTVVRTLITQTVVTTSIDEEGNKIQVANHFDKPFDAVLIGSGDVTNPVSKNNADAFFMIKDENIVSKTFTSKTAPTVITKNVLMNYTDNPFEGVTGSELTTKEREATSKSGWFLNFVEGDGEKSMSSAVVAAGVVYFNSFTPSTDSSAGTCSVGLGESAMYAVDLALGTKVFELRRTVTGYNPGGDPSIVSVDHQGDEDDISQGKDLAIIAPNVKRLCSDSQCTEETLQTQTLRTYLYLEEK